MVKSLLSPEKIIGNKNPKSSFGSLSGKNSLGSSVISKSSNKIVGFNRAKVSTNKGEVQKIVSNLTTNNIANSSNNIIKNIFGSLRAKQNKEEENKEKRFGIFGFFDSIKDAFNLIRFVGSKKNLDKIKDSLENLKITFSETFDTAKILRKIIKKIFDQLSGLSGDGGGGKGLWGLIAAAIAGIIRKLFRGVVKTFSDIFARMSKNENTMRDIIDKISPPPTPQPSAPPIGTAATTAGGIATGSGLASLPAAGTATKALPATRTATKALPEAKGVGNIFSKMPKKGKFGLIAAGLGLATLGGSAMMNKSGLSQPGGEDVQPGDTAPEVPGNVLDRFNSILDRFDKILDGLKGGKGTKGSGSGTGSKSSGSGGGGGGSPTPTPPPGPMADPYDIPGLKIKPGSIGSLDKFKNTLKGTPMEAEAEEIYNTALAEGINPAFIAGLAGAESSFGSKGKAVGRNNPFNYGVYNNQTYSSYAEATKGLARALRDPKGYYFGEGRKDVPSILQKYAPSSDGNNNTVELRNIMSIGGRTGGDPNAVFIPRGSKGGTTVPVPSQLRKPPAAKASGAEAPQVSLVNVGSGTPQASPSRPSSTTTPPSPTGGNGPTAPFYPSSNYDNFLTLYSRMVYNIVDG